MRPPERRSGREAAGEVLGIDLVHGGKVVDVSQEHSGLDDVVAGQVGLSQNGLDVLQGLFGLSLNAALHQVAGGGINGQLAGQEDQAADADSLRVGADGGGGILGGNDVLDLFYSKISFADGITNYLLEGVSAFQLS